MGLTFISPRKASSFASATLAQHRSAVEKLPCRFTLLERIEALE
jgi:hypothetical protein